MKLCSFCGTENAADAVKCSSCGGNEFKYKCDNCGTVFTEGVHCPHCGVKAGQEARTCYDYALIVRFRYITYENRISTYVSFTTSPDCNY